MNCNNNMNFAPDNLNFLGHNTKFFQDYFGKKNPPFSRFSSPGKFTLDFPGCVGTSVYGAVEKKKKSEKKM